MRTAFDNADDRSDALGGVLAAAAARTSEDRGTVGAAPTYMTFRPIAMLVDTDIQLSAAVTARPGVEVYHVANDDDVEMALLNDLITPLKLAFVGGDAPKTFAKEYGGVWIADGPDAEGELLRLWDLPPNY